MNGYIKLPRKTAQRFAAILLTAVIQDNDAQAAELLRACYPEMDWNRIEFDARADAWRLGITQPKALLPEFADQLPPMRLERGIWDGNARLVTSSPTTRSAPVVGKLSDLGRVS
jgi:hypothetical protein